MITILYNFVRNVRFCSKERRALNRGGLPVAKTCFLATGLFLMAALSAGVFAQEGFELFGGEIPEEEVDDTQSYNFFKNGGHWYTITVPQDIWHYQPDVASHVGSDSFFLVQGYSADDSPAGIMTYVVERVTQGRSFEHYVETEKRSIMDDGRELVYEALPWDVDNYYGHDVVVGQITQSGQDFVQYVAFFNADLDYYIKIVMQVFSSKQYYADQFRFIAERAQLLPYSIELEESFANSQLPEGFSDELPLR